MYETIEEKHDGSLNVGHIQKHQNQIAKQYMLSSWLCIHRNKIFKIHKTVFTSSPVSQNYETKKHLPY